jgi:PHD/YefM family antitoxin component YafN of YafNO toxin-antitoxin module
MDSISLSQLVSISDLQRDYASLVEKVKKLAQPLFLLRRNQPEAVLISVPVYEKLIENSRLYEEKLAIDAIAKFEKAKKEGNLLIATKAEDLLE